MSDHGKETEHHGVGHVVPVRILVVTGVGLLVLTVITVAAAQFDFGKANVWVALGIAVLKASLVCLFFMHLRWDRPFNGLVLIISFAFVALFIAFALTDTHEYAHTLDPRDATQVRDKLAELEAPAAAPPGEAGGGGDAPAENGH